MQHYKAQAQCFLSTEQVCKVGSANDHVAAGFYVETPVSGQNWLETLGSIVCKGTFPAKISIFPCLL